MERGCDSTVVIASFFYAETYETFPFLLLFFYWQINNTFPAQLFAVFTIT